ncbi:unnamed protein product, partial [Effrenium voratum]
GNCSFVQLGWAVAVASLALGMSGMAKTRMQKGPPASKEVALWAAVTAATLLTMYLLTATLVAPIRSCEEVPSCVEVHEKNTPRGNLLNGYAICGLSTALVLEMVSLHFSYESARPVLGLINGLDNTFMPPILLCITLSVLIVENLIFFCSSTPWYLNAGAGGSPVYTSIYLEWLINVPILLVLAGTCALDRPASEIAR